MSAAPAAGPAGPTLQDEVAYLNGINTDGTLNSNSFWNANGATARKWGSATAGTGATISYSFDPSSHFTAIEKATFLQAFAIWSAVANVTFIEGTAGTANSNVLLTRGSDGGAHEGGGTTLGSGSTLGSHTGQDILSIDTGVAGFDLSGSLTTKAGYGLDTVIHEVGHLLGLGHGGNYNQGAGGAPVSPGPSQHSAYDMRLWTIMSYVGWWQTDGAYQSSYPVAGTDWGVGDNTYRVSSTWMPLDVLAVQELYGASTDTPLSGGQVFGFHTNITGALQKFFDFTINADPVITLFDEGTDNPLDVSGFSQAATINLTAGTFSSVGGHVNNVGIAFGTVVESAVGGAGSDTITGNSSANLIEGGAGADTIDGGAGSDTASYASSTAGVDIDLSRDDPAVAGYRAPSGGDAAGDRLISIENLIGSDFADRLVGLNEATGSRIDARGGDDTIFAGDGADVIYGGLGADRIYGGGGNDRLYGGDLAGSASDGTDVFTPGTGADVVYGGGGNDVATFNDINNSDDNYDGGAGRDTLVLDWSDATTAVIHLAAGTVNSGELGAVDSYLRAADPNAITDWGQRLFYTSVETLKISGGSADDILAGGNGNDVLTGNDGNDALIGGGGVDVLNGGAGTDMATLTLGGGNNTIDLKRTETAGGYTLANGTTLISIESVNLIAGAGDDFLDVRGTVALDPNRLDRGAAHTSFSGFGGDDTLAVDLATSFGASFDGGTGTNTLIMDWSDATTAIDLYNKGTSQQAYQAYAYSVTVHTNGQDFTTDYYFSAAFQNVQIFDLTGGSAVDTFYGADGDDTLSPGTGYGDTMSGGKGTDTLVVDYHTAAYAVYSTLQANTTDGGYDGYVGNGGSTSYDLVNYTSIEAFQITAGSGNDAIRTGSGNDVITTGAGDDMVYAGDGVDTVDLGSGTNYYEDDVHTQTANITLDLNEASTVQALGTGGTVKGATYVTLTTGSGNDTITTTADDLVDSLSTGAGNDTVKIYGGYGDAFNGGKGTDTLIVDYHTGGNAVYTTLSANTTDGGYDGYVGNGGSTSYDLVNYTSVETFQITTGSGNDSLRTGSGADIVTTGAGDDMVYAGDGVDTVDLGSGVNYYEDDVHSQTANITLDLTKASTVQALGTGGTVKGATYVTLTTGSGNDTITTTADDLVDSLSTGAGNDTVKICGGYGDAFNGGKGTDRLVVDYHTGGNAVYTTLSANTTDGGYDGYVGNGGSTSYDLVNYTSVETFQITTGSGNDSLRTGSGADIVTTGAGDDMVYAGDGVDTVDLGSGVNYYEDDVHSQTANITLDLTKASTVQALGTGGTVKGATYVTLTTGSGNDTITTTADDLVDSLSTGAGNDTVKICGGYGDAFNGGKGTDRLVVDYHTVANSVYSTPTANTTDGGYDGYVGNGGSTSYDLVNYTSIEAFQITTGSGNDTITTGDGNDILNGGEGADILTGGNGSDTYYADEAEDQVVEAVGGGTDTVLASVSYTLAAGQDIEALSTINDAGTVAMTLIGNEFANRLRGNAGANILDGGAGADSLYGLGGNDTYLVDNAGDRVIEAVGGGTDLVKASVSYTLLAGQEVEQLTTSNKAGKGAIDLTGNAFDNVITGNASSNVLKGGGGKDTLDGGLGVDTADYSDKKTAVVVTLDGKTAASVSVGGVAEDTVVNIENLIGGSAADTLTGDGLANTLDGGGGSDVLTGGAGNDIYKVDNASDRVVEAAGGGTDTVLASVDYKLAAGQRIETLATASDKGKGAIDLTGNAFANTLRGDAGVNILDGDAGNDTLSGLGGNDTFVFDTALGTGNIDTILDFSDVSSTVHDTIQIASSIFTGLKKGQLVASAFDDIRTGTEDAHTRIFTTASPAFCRSTLTAAERALRPSSSLNSRTISQSHPAISWSRSETRRGPRRRGHPRP